MKEGQWSSSRGRGSGEPGSPRVGSDCSKIRPSRDPASQFEKKIQTCQLRFQCLFSLFIKQLAFLILFLQFPPRMT